MRPSGLQALLKGLGFETKILGGDMLAFTVARASNEATLQGFASHGADYAHYWVSGEGRLIDMGPHYLPMDSRFVAEPMPLIAWTLSERLPPFLRYRMLENFGSSSVLQADAPIQQRMETFLDRCRRKLNSQIGQPRAPHWILTGTDSLLFYGERGDSWVRSAMLFSTMGEATASLPF